MIYAWVYESYGAGGLFLITISFGLVLYVVLSWSSYAVFFVWRRERFVPDYRPDGREMRRSTLWSLYSVAGNALLVLPVQLLIVAGNSRVYYDFDAGDWYYVPISFVGAMVVSETMIYWIHRALHTKFLYRHLHIHHHRFRVPTPLSCMAFHPLDSFAQSFPYHLYALFVPVNFWLYLAMVAFVSVWSVMIHDRVRWVPGGIVNHTGCHTAHHWYFNCNYGQYFTLWDRLCGTFRDPADLPDRFFASISPLIGWPTRATGRAGERNS